MSQHFENLRLVQEMGAPKYDGYNPIAPRSHRWMMDAAELEETRVFGWVLWRTIDRDPKGQTGPPKKGRTAFAHDERAGKHGHLDVKHLAPDLGMSPANATDALRRAVEKGKVRSDEKGRIFPRGDAPEPRRIHGEDGGEGNEREEPIFFCTEKSPEAYRLIFQSLDKFRRAQYVRRYRSMPEPFAKHLESLDPEQRAWHTWDYLHSAEYKEQLEADAAAAARAIGRDNVERSMAAAGYVDTETRGRKEVKRELTLDLSVRIAPEQFFVQKNGRNFVQKGNSILYKGENGSVQKTASLLGFSEFSETLRVSESGESTPQPRRTAPPPTHSSSQEGNKAKTEAGLVEVTIADLIEELTGKRPDTAVVANLGSYAMERRIAVPEFCRFLRDKHEELVKRGYPITSLKLFENVCGDFPLWRKQHANKPGREGRFERGEVETVVDGVPTSERRREFEALLNDPQVPEDEKRIARIWLGMEQPERKPVDSEPGAPAQKAGRA